ncbi:MAG: ArnT family glycosyltransferase [Anaerolineae bacterium]
MKPGKVRIVALMLFLISLGLAVAGQLAFQREPPSGLRSGLVFYALAIVMFIAAASSLEHRVATQPWSFDWSRLKPHVGSVRPLSACLFVAGVLGVCYAALTSGTLPSERPQYDLLLAWGLGLTAVLLSFINWAYLLEHARAIFRRLLRPSPETVLIALMTLATFLLRVINLEHIPFVLSGDEASMGLEAVSVMQGQLTNPFTTTWLSHPTLYFFMQALVMRLGGINTATLRWPSAVCAAISVIWLYKLSRQWYGRRIALIAALLYASYHYAIHFGRLALNNIWDPFFALGVLWYVQRGLDERRTWPWAVAGLLLGLSIYVYMGARLIPFILIVFLAVRWLQGVRMWRDHRWHVVCLVLVAFLAALPLLNHYRLFPSDLTARWHAVGIIPNGWLSTEPLVTGKTQFTLLAEQFAKSILAFNLFRDPTFHYYPGIPLLQFVPAILFVLGVVSSLWRPLQKANLTLLVWFFLVMIMGGMLLENPPSSARLVLAIPAVLLLVALGVDRVCELLATIFGQPRVLATVLALSLTVGISYGSANFYFNRYTPSSEYGGLNTAVADSMGRYLRSLGPGHCCLFFGPPRMYYNFATIPFLAQGVVGVNAPEQPSNDLSWIAGEGKPVFAFLPERLGELDQVKELYPQGTLREFKNNRGDALFFAYEVSSP